MASDLPATIAEIERLCQAYEDAHNAEDAEEPDTRRGRSAAKRHQAAAWALAEACYQAREQLLQAAREREEMHLSALEWTRRATNAETRVAELEARLSGDAAVIEAALAVVAVRDLDAACRFCLMTTQRHHSKCSLSKLETALAERTRATLLRALHPLAADGKETR